MGQKVNPHGLRVGVIKDWDSRWYAEADFADNLEENLQKAVTSKTYDKLFILTDEHTRTYCRRSHCSHQFRILV